MVDLELVSVLPRAGVQGNCVVLCQRRWVILFIHGLLLTSVSCIAYTAQSVSVTLKDYFGVGIREIERFSVVNAIVAAASVFTGTYCIGLLRLKMTMTIAALAICVGSWMRFAGSRRSGYTLNIAGTGVAAFAGGVSLVIVPRMSAIWFGKKEYSFSNSVCYMSYNVGLTLGFLQPTSMIGKEPVISQLEPVIRWLFLSQAIFCSTVLVLVVVFVRDQPPVPPSEMLLSTTSEPLPPCSLADSLKATSLHLWQFVRNPAALCILITIATYYGLNITLLTVLDPILHPFYSESGFIGTVMNASGGIALPIMGFVLDRIKAYRMFTACSFISCSLMLILIFLILYCTSLIAPVFIFAGIYGAASNVFFVVGMELLVKVTHPLPENICATFSEVVGNMTGPAVLELTALVMSKFGGIYGLLFTAACYFVTWLCIAWRKFNFKTLAEKTSAGC